MTALSDLQTRLTEVLRRRKALDKLPEERAFAARIATGNERVSPVRQVDIYREQYWLRHSGALVEDYPGLGGILGQADWQRLVESYLEAHPPDSFTLRDLGAGLPEHVRRSDWLPHHALCADMARLEWTWVEVFDAADADPLDPEKVAAVREDEWQHTRLVLHPALRLLRVDYPVADLRKALRALGPDDEAPPIPEREPARLVLYRTPDYVLRWQTLDAPAFELLGALHAGAPLPAACERAVERCGCEPADIEANLGGWFASWTAQRWVVDLAPVAAS